ncbi:mandelate racemase/muconate lactonizing enzyme family protein [Actinomadura viridis]|uniref:mandelate racemase/muconate lactonizing enzyme family protein n=1 Tax=Actinomadura viridis TaxID=58110 RepID=UPI00369FC655
MIDRGALPEVRVTGIDAALCSFPLRHPIRFGRATYHTRDYVLVRIRTDTATGYGAALTRNTPLLESLRPVARRLVGFGAAAGLSTVRGLRYENVPAQAASVRAHSLADLALWDVLSRSAGRPLAALLGGGSSRTSVDVVAIAGYLIDVRGEEAIVEELTGLVERGFRQVKLMLGAREPAWMHAFLARCREAVGDDVALSLDLHYSIVDLEEAVALCAPLEEFGLAFIEDVFGPHRWRDLRALAARIATPLAAGEDVVDPVAYADLLESVRLLRVDASTCGGVEDALDGIAAGGRAGTPVLPHGSPWIGAQLAAVSPVVAAVEVAAPVETGDRFAELCPEARLLIEDGRLTIGADPGVDVPLDWERVEALAVRSWSL